MNFLVKILFILFFSCQTCVVKSNEYLINSKKCKIPNINPFSEDVEKLVNRWPYLPCNRSELLTYITKKNNVATLHVKEELINRLANENFYCCLSNVTRDGSLDFPDVGIRISECQPFEKQVVLSHDVVMVKCRLNEAIIYENVHSVITIKDSVKKKVKINKENKPISVLFIVIDSISRLNFIRTMPKTRNFLRQNNFIEMKGYNKVGENTFPNFMALLTGFNLSQSIKHCNPYKINKLDECPMIWYDYSNLGYITAYAEDFDVVNTFNYGGKRGFTKPPTDYYFKSYIAAAENLGVLEVFGMPYCSGPKTSGERILNVAKDFASTFKDYSTFGVFWMNTFSHNEVNCPSMMDSKMKEFFRDIKDMGVLDRNIVIFLSDHGIRFGNIRFTRSGWFEERLPVNMISVPKTFQQEFSTEYDNLKKNSEKLTNTYDMYMTLQHILNLSNVSYESNLSKGCPKCKSLFEEIFFERSCQDASIAPEWCSCIF